MTTVQFGQKSTVDMYLIGSDQNHQKNLKMQLITSEQNS